MRHLHYATDVVIARSLIDKGAYVNAKEQHGETKFSLAYKTRNIELARFLLKNKADFNYAKQQCRV